jgi:uncharacterized membrane protein YgcG
MLKGGLEHVALTTQASDNQLLSSTDAYVDNNTKLQEDERIVDETLTLTPEQRQMLEQENRHLINQLESTLDQVRWVVIFPQSYLYK